MEHQDWNRYLVESYDRVAQRYAEQFFNELDRKPFDRELLNRYAERLHGRGKVCDLGCGPGHVARYLHSRGLDVFGVDISPRMVEVARGLNPTIPFAQADMLKLSLADSCLAGIAAFYSLIHLS